MGKQLSIESVQLLNFLGQKKLFPGECILFGVGNCELALIEKVENKCFFLLLRKINYVIEEHLVW